MITASAAGAGKSVIWYDDLPTVRDRELMLFGYLGQSSDPANCHTMDRDRLVVRLNQTRHHLSLQALCRALALIR